MTKLVCSTSRHSVGCTFLDWSINYLRGASKFFNRKLGWIDLINDPLTSQNAHGHRKNHPSGFLQTCEYVNFMQGNSEFVSLYPCPITFESAASSMNKSLVNIDEDSWKQLVDYCDNDYNQMLQWLEQQGTKIIFVSINKSLPLYVTGEVRALEKLTNNSIVSISLEEIRQSRDAMFFQQSVSEWEKIGLVDVWDVRERLALDTRPFRMIAENVDFSFDHYWIDCQELWFNGDKKILDILDWLEIKVDTDRYNNWLTIYHKWRQLQSKTFSFQLNHQHIVESIVNGWSYPIDLTFDQEVIIQHCLIYQHNLNLKTWELRKFPNNTKDLHQLLEPNIHPIEKYVNA